MALDSPSPGAAVLQADDGSWRSYREPVALLAAWRLEQVAPLLATVEAACARGLHAAGLVCYEAAPAFDPALTVRSADPRLPLAWFGLYPSVTVSDQPPPSHGDCQIGATRPELSRTEYDSGIARIKAAIAAGETYQVNYTYRLQAGFAGSPWALANQLWASQQGRHGGYLDLGDLVVCSASPELFLARNGEALASRPMKGTRRRGPYPAADDAQAADLHAAVKDRAENLMIVDMIRNDLGRVAAVGSVSVPELFTIERYRTVWQMTSLVTARSEASLPELFAALFPCASVTGAPKISTMRLISELEQSPRGAYCGALGWVAPGRQASFNVAIRTATVDRCSGQLTYGTGGGIVWDSTAADEWRESQAKTLVLTAQRPDFQLLETLLWEPGRGVFLANRHLARLAASAAWFDYQLDQAAIVAALAGVDADGPLRLRLLVSADGTVELQQFPHDPSPPARPWRLALAAEPVDPADPFLYHKTTCRGVYDAARAAFPEADDVLLQNPAGEITEACLGNVAVWLDDRLVTPPVRCGLLAGTYREVMLERGWLTERVVRVEDLPRAQGIFLLNSVRRWVACELLG